MTVSSTGVVVARDGMAAVPSSMKVEEVTSIDSETLGSVIAGGEEVLEEDATSGLIAMTSVDVERGLGVGSAVSTIGEGGATSGAVAD